MKTPRAQTPLLKKKNPHAVALGRNGGKARKAALSAEERSNIARAAINTRWRRERAKLKAANPNGRKSG